MRVRLESNQMIWDEHSRNNISKSIKLLQSAKHNNSCALLCFQLLLTSSSFNPRDFNMAHIIRGLLYGPGRMALLNVSDTFSEAKSIS